MKGRGGRVHWCFSPHLACLWSWREVGMPWEGEEAAVRCKQCDCRSRMTDYQRGNRMFLAHRPGAPHMGVGRGRFEGEALGVEGGAALEKEEDGVDPVGLRGPQRHAEHRPGLRRGEGPSVPHPP